VQHQLETAITISILRETSPSQLRRARMSNKAITPATHQKGVCKMAAIIKMVNNPAIHEIYVNWFCMGQNYTRVGKKAWKIATKAGRIASGTLIYRRLVGIVVFVEVLERRNAKMFFKEF